MGEEQYALFWWQNTHLWSHFIDSGKQIWGIYLRQAELGYDRNVPCEGH